ncbi:MAG TPA: monofunctional biosynthetic peptidoglycan transglycosylase [Chitinophagales bacterium]|nr:monofunctional biosynthetic peptidoglycan transglycosylase [Chitinophagales bacterium]HNM33019.1 monofunctional biosynthetic peptidoglycan transglycosylase [Chitinophagales bacterium]
MKVILQQAWKWVKRIIVVFFIFSILSALLFRFIPIPVTPLMLIRCVEQIAAGEPPKIHKEWVSLQEMSPNLVLAVISSEDQKFSTHFGFDFDAIEKVAKQNIKLQKRGKPIKGGSTISQQCAKNVFLFPQRSYLRKGLEVYFTFLIELFWSKKRIMEVYLNVIEMGNGIYGAEAASKDFFKKDAKNLTPSEAATLAAVLPNPRKWNAGKPNGYILKRKNWILKQMGHLRGTVEL